jgi:ribonuclease PH
MNVIMTGAGNLVELQATGEARAFSRDELNRLMDAARPAIESLVALQKSILGLDLKGK